MMRTMDAFAATVESEPHYRQASTRDSPEFTHCLELLLSMALRTISWVAFRFRESIPKAGTALQSPAIDSEGSWDILLPNNDQDLRPLKSVCSH